MFHRQNITSFGGRLSISDFTWSASQVVCTRHFMLMHYVTGTDKKAVDSMHLQTKNIPSIRYFQPVGLTCKRPGKMRPRIANMGKFMLMLIHVVQVTIQGSWHLYHLSVNTMPRWLVLMHVIRVTI
ncbi:Orotidine 5'-phosphate decarboxylase [Gossypium arboreum]|uniref:Orotidine 5'-phosphate decarboxylase n=1 Tax=Gossypium arboreum TaxID=29729 RepID=A0A0B0PQD1_GOSAR|nr:Orotidine 5'-phosphate decarboxylase [Gossypium arboreum]KHG27195.1 Orotidine 5'-phosphate decarboxylase [Gossypium arboreum]